MGALAGSSNLHGTLAVRHVTRAQRVAAVEREAASWRRRNWWRMLRTGELFVPALSRLASRYPGLCVLHGTLSARLTRADGTVLDLGVVGHHLVTTAGKNYLAGSFNNTNEPENLKYHGAGTGSTAASAADTVLVTESTTALNPDSTRATGSQGVSTNVYTTAGTLTFDATAAIVEWGLFSQAATGGGTLFDRQVFSAVNVASGDSITFTYVHTVS